MFWVVIEGLEGRRLLTASPVAHYTFEEGSGVAAADSSGAGNTLGLVGGAGFGQGLIARHGLALDGDDDHASAVSSPSLNPEDQLTIAAWVNAADWDGNRRIVQKGANDNQYRLTAEFGRLKFSINNVGSAACELPASGEWHHVAGTYDGSMLRIYVDGVLLGAGSGSGDIPITGDGLVIGNKNNSSPPSDHFIGRIDDVRIYSVALIDSEVQLLAGVVNVNFQPAASTLPQRFVKDAGEIFGDRGNGLGYGWNVSHVADASDRNLAADQRLDTLIQVHSGGVWELAVSNGSYDVIVGIGDALEASVNTINVEGVSFAGAVPLAADEFQTLRQTVTVTDGRLTLDNGAAAAGATRVDYVQVLALQPAPNTAPATPTITEPGFDGKVVNPADAHMEAPGFSDADAGDTHESSDWEIRVQSTGDLVWLAYAVTGVERVHLHLADGQFIGSHESRTELQPGTNYVLRVRHRDNHGLASNFAQRLFTTGPRSSTAPLELDDVAAAPAPAWVQAGGSSAPVELPPGASMTLGSAADEPVLRILGQAASGNTIINPPQLSGGHIDARVKISASPAATLTLPQTNLSFNDDTGKSHVLYLPAVSLGPGESANFWVGADGSTYTATAAQTEPDFDSPARLAPVPFVASQPGYVVEVFATGFQLPTNIAFVPNPGPDPDDVFFYVTELYGTIKAVTRDGTIFDYASGLLNFNPTGDFPGSGEQGVTGIAIDPTSGDIFVDMTYSVVPGVEHVDHYGKVVRLHSSDGGRSAASVTTVLNMPELMGYSHIPSNISIGPADGKLYVHVGDGFNSDNAQNLDTFRGKILRMNLDGTAAADNPFYDAADGITPRDYVFAYGLRNPFGGAWRQADGKHYEVENGPAVDRIAQVVAGRNYLYDGTDASMHNFAIYNWDPPVAPVNMAFAQSGTFGGSGFPASKLDHMFITESGPTYASGPQDDGKRISEFVLDAAGALVGSGPVDFVTYAGTGKGTFAALAAGPDGLYFSELYKDQDASTPIDQGARIFRVRYIGGIAPAVTVTPVATTDKTPALTGTVSDPAATVQVTVNGVTYPAANNGDGTWTLPDNTIAPPLPDGTYNVQVSAANIFGTVGSDATTAELRIDTTPPQVSGFRFLYDAPIIPGRAHTIEFVVSEAIGTTLEASDLQVVDRATESPIPQGNIALDYDPLTRTARFTFPGFSGGVMPSGNYTATLLADAISDPLGNTLHAAQSIDFFFLAADIDHDRDVDGDDLGILSMNWQQSPRDFSHGDLNYDGVVDVNDLNILATQYQSTLPPPTPPSPFVRTRPRTTRLIRAIEL